MAELAAVMFDLDDTLFDHSGSATRGSATWLAGLRAVHLDRRGTGPADERDRIASLRDLAAHLA